MDKPVISAIVPVYKVEQYLEKCVRSLTDQTLRNIEILLVDDGSPDGCPALCDALAKEDERIRVIHKANGGLSDARNAGIEAAAGDYLLFVDGDDYILPELCGVLYEMLQSSGGEIAAAGFLEEYEDGSQKNWQPEKKNAVFTGKEALLELLQGRMISAFAWGKLYKKELFERVRYPKGLTYEDLYIAPEIFLQAKKAAATTRPLCVYRRRRESLTTQRYSPKAMDVITACRHAYEVVQKGAPELLPAAAFRLYRSYFIVLDRMLFEKKPEEIPEYKEVVSFLKSHWKEIVKCPYFIGSRRAAALALKAGVPFYKILWRMQMKKSGGIAG